MPIPARYRKCPGVVNPCPSFGQNPANRADLASKPHPECRIALFSCHEPGSLHRTKSKPSIVSPMHSPCVSHVAAAFASVRPPRHRRPRPEIARVSVTNGHFRVDMCENRWPRRAWVRGRRKSCSRCGRHWTNRPGMGWAADGPPNRPGKRRHVAAIMSPLSDRGGLR